MAVVLAVAGLTLAVSFNFGDDASPRALVETRDAERLLFAVSVAAISRVAATAFDQNGRFRRPAARVTV